MCRRAAKPHSMNEARHYQTGYFDSVEVKVKIKGATSIWNKNVWEYGQNEAWTLWHSSMEKG